MQDISKFFTQGGFWMWPILFMSVLGLAVMVERFVFLYFKHNINAREFMRQIQKLVMGGNVDRAIKLCNSAPDAALAKVIKSGLTRANPERARGGLSRGQPADHQAWYAPSADREHCDASWSPRDDPRSDSSVQRARDDHRSREAK